MRARHRLRGGPATAATAALVLCALLAANQAAAQEAPPECTPDVVSRIAFGAGSGALNVEGGAASRAQTVWDAYVTANPGAIADRSTPARAADFYNRYKADIEMMKGLKLKHFRLSLSWARLIPGAKRGSPVDPTAAAYYSSVLDGLLAAGIQPMVALYHWDLPQSLQEAYGGFTSQKVVDDYTYFADTAFRLFGPKVKTWLTFIEPSVICNQQYGNGQFAPGINYGDAGRYACGHNVLLSHAAAVKIYRSKYAAAQGGKISFTTLITWAEPASAAAADVEAAQNKLDAEVGWFLDPVFKGDYPGSLRSAKGASLPRFSPSDAASLRGSLDFIAANCFSGKWAFAGTGGGGKRGAWKESKTNPYNGTAVGPASGMSWIDVAPWTQGRAWTYLQQRYGDPEILISSSGVMGPGEAAASPQDQLKDSFRLEYFKSYLNEICRAIRSSRVKIIGWYAWSLLDSWEWREGFTTKFGIVRVSYADGSLARTPKSSALWLSRHFFEPGAAAAPGSA